ncbi:MAG: NADH:ubiquinone reductase (Na(+)-transporting) subunit B [Tannerellaceae bacterium]|nr:NADH:ubiquinone reductase (Na(+)-transporting) subunit B [Tannerellaceae bacterium]
MKVLKDFYESLRPHFEEGGRFSMFRSVYEGMDSFLFVPDTTSRTGVHIHDSMDAKRTMTAVIVSLIFPLLFGIYNTGYQHNLSIGADPGFVMTFLYGLLSVLPQLLVSYVVGLGIEFTVAQWKGEEIQEGFLVSGMLIPLIVPVDTPLWMIAVATAFAVIFAKEVFGGTGYNIFNVALVTRAFLFFAYPASMSGDKVFVRTAATFGIGGGEVVDGFSGATPLGQVGIATKEMIGTFQAVDVTGQPLSTWDMFWGLIPGSIGETSVAAILLGGILLLYTGVASWKTMLSVFVGGAAVSALFNLVGTTVAMSLSPIEHLCLGGFAFGAVFMATDPVTSARTETGKYIYGFLVGAMAILIRVLNPGYPEGMMLAILLMNIFAPLIDYFVVERNITRRLQRVKK